VWNSWQLCGSFTVSPQGQRISYWTCVHMKTTCTKTLHETELTFMYYMLLYPTKLQIYRSPKLLHVSLSSLYYSSNVIKFRDLLNIWPFLNWFFCWFYYSVSFHCIYNFILLPYMWQWKYNCKFVWTVCNIHSFSEYSKNPLLQQRK
jgi:hypothetical protein